jgi:hypothetical protein
MPIVGNILLVPSVSAERSSGAKLFYTRADGARDVTTIVVWKRWSFTIWIPHIRILASPAKDIRAAGPKSVRSWINAYSFARTVIERFMPDCSFHRKLWLKLRVNSGKPAPSTYVLGMVILSEACRRVSVGRNVQRLEAEEPVQ